MKQTDEWEYKINFWLRIFVILGVTGFCIAALITKETIYGILSLVAFISSGVVDLIKNKESKNQTNKIKTCEDEIKKIKNEIQLLKENKNE